MAAFNLNHVMKPSQIHNTELQNGNQIYYLQLWHALKKIEKQVFGNEAESFKKIPFFLKNLSQIDLQAYWQLETQNSQFFYLFIISGLTQEAFHWYRSFIALDSTFWKTH